MQVTSERALEIANAHEKEGNFQKAAELYLAILKTEPKHPKANHKLGILLVDNHQIDKAIPFLIKAIESGEQQTEYWNSLIVAFRANGQFSEAQEIYEKAKSKGIQAIMSGEAIIENKDEEELPNDKLQNIMKLYSSGLFKEALQKATDLTIKFPNSNKLLNLKGAILQNLNEFELAIDVYKKIMANDPSYVEAHNNIGNAFKKLGRYDEAITSFNKAIALKADYLQPHNNLGNVLQELGYLNEAIELYDKVIALDPNHVGAHNNKGNALKLLGKLDDAVEYYDFVLRLEPDNISALNNKGHTFKELGKLDIALETYEKALQVAPHSAQVYNFIGLTLHAQEKWGLAIENYKKAISLQTNYAEAFNNMGVALQEQRKPKEAIEAYKQAIAIYPKYAEAHNNMGVTFQAVNKFDEAITAYRRAIEINPSYAEAYNNLGNSLEQLEHASEAISAFKKAISIKPNYYEAYYNHAATLHRVGDYDGMMTNLKSVNAFTNSENFIHSFFRLPYELISKAREHGKFRQVSQSRPTSQDFPIIMQRNVESELIDCLYSMESRKFEETKDSRYGHGRCSTGFDLFNSNASIIQKVAKDLLAMMEKELNVEILHHESFFNILGVSGGTPPHSHLKARDKQFDLEYYKYSLVYYLSVGDQNCSEPGILKVYKPDLEILPTEGMIILMPASRKHSAVYNGELDRIMIGCNFYAV